MLSCHIFGPSSHGIPSGKLAPPPTSSAPLETPAKGPANPCASGRAGKDCQLKLDTGVSLALLRYGRSKPSSSNSVLILIGFSGIMRLPMLPPEYYPRCLKI